MRAPRRGKQNRGPRWTRHKSSSRPPTPGGTWASSAVLASSSAVIRLSTRTSLPAKRIFRFARGADSGGPQRLGFGHVRSGSNGIHFGSNRPASIRHGDRGLSSTQLACPDGSAMLSVTDVISTYCFVDSPEGPAQVLWLDLESTDDDELEVWAEAPG